VWADTVHLLYRSRVTQLRYYVTLKIANISEEFCQIETAVEAKQAPTVAEHGESYCVVKNIFDGKFEPSAPASPNARSDGAAIRRDRARRHVSFASLRAVPFRAQRDGAGV
jgi:hypothetical protein